jgi:photosystem II stability/assembly factor-like uncharacterized protein
MKKLLIIILFAGLSNISLSQSVWNLQNSGTLSNLNEVYLQYNQLGFTIWIVGDNGTILRSSNNGLIWENVISGTTANLYSIEIIYNDTGFVVGANGTILRTTNGGNSWMHVPSETTSTFKDIKIYYSNSLRAFAIGGSGTYSQYTNGNWISTLIDTTNLNSIIFNGIGTRSIVGNYGTVLKTTDSGLNWYRINSGISHNLNSISRFNSFIVGQNGTLLRINNNAINILSSGTSINLNSIYSFPNTSNHVICGDSGAILKNLIFQQSNTTVKLNSIEFLNGNVGWIAGNNGTILFTNTFSWTNNAKQLNSNNIGVWFLNNGLFNQHPAFEGGGFEWPRGEYKFARYSSGSLIGATVNSDTLVTVCAYESEYRPGFTINGMPQGNGTSDFKVYRLVFNVNDSNRMKWPNSLLGNSDQGAPIYFDSLSMNWKPIDYGNQTIFYSYTDSYLESHTHPAGRTAPLKADVKQINYSFNQPVELKNIIYQEHRIINRSNNQWTNAYINLWSDDDLGESHDDAEGIDTNLNLAYTYNFDNNDPDYGFNPPAVGFVIIRSPLFYTGNNNDTVFYCEGMGKKIKTGYKEIKLNSTVIYHDDTWEPRNYRESFNAIRGLQNNGSHYINPITNQPTKFVYSGDPVTNTGWNSQFSGDMRFYQGFGPLNINPGDTQIIVIAQVIARGTSNLNSITKLRETSQIAKQYYDDCFSNVVIGIKKVSESIPSQFYLHQNYPNPFNPSTVIRYDITFENKGLQSLVLLKVYDVLGKEVITLVNEKQNAGSYEVEFNGSNFSSGIYFYQLTTENFSDTKRMLLIK